MLTAIRRLLSYYDAAAVLTRAGTATPKQRDGGYACYRRASQLIDRYYPYTDQHGRKVEA